MTETLYIPPTQDKKVNYEAVIPQIKALVASEKDLIANLANVSAVLKEVFDFFWVGFYLVKDDELVLGPFQGTLACTRIAFDKGVCGACYRRKESIIVPDVEAFEGHIACSSLTKSEIVIPILKNDTVLAVLDIDSKASDDFDTIDRDNLEHIATILSETL